MKFNDLVNATGLRICEGGPFIFEDFGPSWVLLFEDELTATVVLETQEVVFVEVVDIENSNQAQQNMYMWMNPKFANYEKKIYEEVAGAINHRTENIQDVFDIWHKNQGLYENMPQQAFEEMQKERQFIEEVEAEKKTLQ